MVRHREPVEAALVGEAPQAPQLVERAGQMPDLDAELHRVYRELVPIGVFAVLIVLVILALAGLAFALVVMRQANRPRPALPVNCGDCMFMIPRAKVYKRETLEDADGIVHYLCEKRWIEVTPVSPKCELGKSKTRTTTVPT